MHIEYSWNMTIYIDSIEVVIDTEDKLEYDNKYRFRSRSLLIPK